MGERFGNDKNHGDNGEGDLHSLSPEAVRGYRENYKTPGEGRPCNYHSMLLVSVADDRSILTNEALIYKTRRIEKTGHSGTSLCGSTRFAHSAILSQVTEPVYPASFLCTSSALPALAQRLRQDAKASSNSTKKPTRRVDSHFRCEDEDA